MSTKSTIFLTDDYGEHCYEDVIESCTDDCEKNVIYMELDFRNIEIDNIRPNDGLTIKFTKADSEIYKLIEKLKQ